MELQVFETKRDTVPEMEKYLGEIQNTLPGGGFIRLVDYMGSDRAVLQAARVSYGSGTKTRSTDRGLTRYLMRHRHTTPYEMCEIKLHVKLPIFVARQWIRHRTANVNEYSARYSILEKEFYIPDVDQIAIQSTDNKQGRGQNLTLEQARKVQDLLRATALKEYETYETLLNDKGDGTPVVEEDSQLARELARMSLNTSYYTQWYWKVDLHNLFHFLSLRMHPHAQYEIRVYADKIAEMVKEWVPDSWEAFSDYRLGGVFLSRMEKEVISELLEGSDRKVLGKKLKTRGCSDREIRYFMDRFNVSRKK